MKANKPTSSVAATLAASLTYLALGTTAASGALTWSSTGLTANWSTAAGNENWTGNVLWTQNESALFDSSSGTAEAINVTTANIFDDITFDVTGFSITSSGAGNFTLANDLASTITVTNLTDSASFAETMANNAGGASSLTKAGLGTLTLNGTANNTYSEGTFVTGGTLAAGQVGSLGTGPVSLSSGTTLNLTSTATGDITYTGLSTSLSGSGTVNVSLLTGTSTRLLNGNYSAFTGTLNVGVATANGGGKIQFNGLDNASATVNVLTNATVYVSSATAVKTSSIVLNGGDTGESIGQLRLDSGATWAGPVTLSGSITGANDSFVGASSGPSTISGNISETGASRLLGKGGAGILVLTGANTFSGGVKINNASLSVPSFGNTGVAGPVGTGSTISIGNTTTGATLLYTGTGETTDRVLNLSGTIGNPTITNSATGPLKFTSDLTATGVGAKNLTLQGSTAGTAEISGIIGNLFNNGTTLATTAAAAFASGVTTITVNSVTGVVIGATASGTGIAASQRVTSITGAAAPFTIVLSAATTAAITANQAITFTAPNAITKSGTGTWILSGDNTFIGNVNIATGGVLRIASNNALGSSVSGSTNVVGNAAGTGRLELAGGITSAENINLEARQTTSANTPAISNLSGDNTLSAIITGSTGGSTYNIESQSGLLTLSGGFTLTSGATGAGRNLQLQGAGNGRVSGVISDNAANTGFTSVTKQGSGTWTLSGTNTNTGPTTVSAGTLRLDYGTNNTSKLSDSGILTLSGGTLDLTGGTHAEIVTSTTLTAGTTSTVTASGSTLQLNTVTANSGAIINFGAGNIATTDNANVNGILPWARVWNGSSYVYGVNSTDLADGPIIAFSAFTDIDRNSGIIPNGISNQVRITDGPGSAGNVTLAAIAPATNIISSLLVNAAAGLTTVNLAGNTLSVGGETGGNIWLTDTAGGLTIGTSANNGSLTTGNTDNATAATLDLINDSLANSLTVNAAITNNGTDPVAVVKSGAGALTLTGTNTHTGGTTLVAGTLNLGNAAALGSGTLTLTGGALDNSTGSSLVLSTNNAQTWNGNFGFTGTNDLNLGTGGVALGTAARTVTVNAGILTADGVVSSGTGGGVVKTGPGHLVLSGANTYTGATTVNGGSLTLSNGFSGAPGIITLNTAGTNSTLNITGGTYAMAANAINVGNSATTPITATVNQTGGAITFTGGNALLVGQNAVGNKGVYNLSGGSITSFASATRGIMLGVNTNPAPGPDSGGGTFNLSGTGVINMTLASGAPGDGLLEIGRSDATASNTTNAFNQTGGTANVGILTLGGAASAGSTGVSATLNLTGGVFSANQFTLLSAAGTNTSTIIIGGTADVTLPAFPTVRGAGSTATLFLDGGTLKPLAGSTAYLGGLTNAFVKSGGARINTNSFDITVSQNLLADTVSTGGGLTKEGLGVLTLTGANTYTGNTTVTAGTLSVSNAAFANSSTVSVAAGAVLNLSTAGTDTVASLVLNGVAQAPGVYDTTTSSPFITGLGSITVGPNLNSFTSNNFGGETNPLIIGPTADPDGDGVINVFEYAFASNPNAPSRANLPVAGTSVVGPNTFVGCVYTRVKGASDLTFTVQFSNTPDASGFADATEGVHYTSTLTNSTATTETFTIRDNTAVTPGTKRFVRILVTYPNP